MTPEVPDPPWSRFRVGALSANPRWTNPDCQPLETVSHVAHVPTAVRIAEDRTLRADLVFDESKLNQKRIRVVWLSPNYWSGAGGFRYGNVRLTFEWAPLVAGRRCYWVESVAYGIEACRLLLTTEDYSGELDPYDPTHRDGPWWRAPDGRNYWNGEITLEVMIEGDLALDAAMSIDFVQHHERRCSLYPAPCPYKGWSGSKGGAEFLARLASRRRSFDLRGLTETRDGALVATSDLYGAVSLLLQRCERATPESWGLLARDDPRAPSLARAVLSALADEVVEGDFLRLAAFFRSSGDLKAAVQAVLASAAGLPSPAALIDV